MILRDRLLLVVGFGGAAVAVALALGMGHGTVDQAQPQPLPPAPGPGRKAVDAPPVPKARGLRPLGSPAGLLPEAAAAVAGTWRTLETGTAEEAGKALHDLGEAPPPSCEGAAPQVLEALAPALGDLIGGAEGSLPREALHAAAGLARRGRRPGREVLARSGLLQNAFALQVVAGPTDLRIEAARLLGFVGGRDAEIWLVRLLLKAPETEVRVAAIEALGLSFEAAGSLAPESAAAVGAAFSNPAAPVEVTRACLRMLVRAHPAFAASGIGGPAARALDDPDTRADAIDFFDASMLPAGGPGMVRAVEDPDPRIVERAADVLVRMRPPGAHAVLVRRLATLSDPEARKSVERAILATR